MEKQSNKRDNPEECEDLEMPHKNWNDLNNLSLILVAFFGFWGGFLNYIRRTKTNPNLTLKQRLFNFIVDAVSTSSFSIITYLGLIGYGVNDLFAVAVAGFIGHQGTRAIYVMEIFLAEKFGGNETIQAIKESHSKENK